jgi:hypothetical protein
MVTTNIEEKHLAWSFNQSRILSADGKALEYYSGERGFPFQEDELPHHHLAKNDTQQVFRSWLPSIASTASTSICGAWKRPLFCGVWEHSTEDEESVFNVQTNSLFIDLRIPTSRKHVLPAECTSLACLTEQQLRFYARQHVFGGFSKVTTERDREVCTRHHCLDWNYVPGNPRPRPNKWWIEMHPKKDMWKEWAYATDDFGQHYYMERWERLEEGRADQRLALRKQEGSDGILVVVGDHFNYLLSRNLLGTEDLEGRSTLVEVVDAALTRGDRSAAESFLSMDAGHGRISIGWKIDAAIQPWREGYALFEDGDIAVEGDSIDTCHVMWKGSRWSVYESSFETINDLRNVLCPSRKRCKI